jgi:hypothetical protein
VTDHAAPPTYLRAQYRRPLSARLVTLALIVLTGTLAGVAAGVVGKVWT